MALLARDGFDHHVLDAFCVFGVKEGAWSTLVEIHFLSSLVWEGLVNTCFRVLSARAGMVVFVQCILRYILCSRWLFAQHVLR